MSDTAALYISVDSSEADKGAKSLADLARQGQVTEKALHKTGESGKSLKGIGQEADVASRAMSSLALAAKGLVATMGVGQIIQMSDSYTKFTAQLKLATTSTQEYATAYKDVQRISKTAQADLSATAVLYARIANGTRELGISQERVAKITESVNLAMKVSGATAEESASAMMQLSQAFASGVLRGEEFNAVNEAAPRLMKALADGMGVAVGGLRDMATEGQITSQVMAEALPKALEKLRVEAKGIETIGGSFTNLKNEVLQLVGTQAQASGFVTAVSGGLNVLADNLGIVIGLTGTFAAARLAGTLGSVAVGMKDLAVAGGLAKSALAFMGGPVGLLTTAVIGGAAAWISYKDSADEVRNSLLNLADPLDQVRERFEKLTQLEQARALDGLRAQIEESGAAMKEALKSLESVPLKLRVSPDFADFKKQIQAITQSDIGADELERKLTSLVTGFLATVPGAASARDAVENFANAAVKAARSTEELTERQDALAPKADSAANAMSRLAIEAAKAAAGLDTKKWVEYIEKLDTAAATVGMNAGQLAEYAAQSMGASTAQAQLAGVLAASSEAAKNFQKATEDKDSKAMTGAKNTLGALVAQEVQLRVNIKRAQEFAALMAMGLTQIEASRASTLNAESARPGFQEEALARVAAVLKNIAALTASTSAASTKGVAAEASAYANLLAAVRARTEESKLELAAGTKATEIQKIRIKLDADLASGKLKLTAAHKEQIKQELRLAEIAAGDVESYKIRAAAQKDRLDLTSDAVKAAYDEARQNEDLARTFGMSKAAIESETVAYLESQLAKKDELKLTAQQIEALEALLDARKRNAVAIGGVETKETAKKYAEEWQRTNEKIGDQLTEALMRGFESGKSFAENFRDTLKNMFKTLILQPIIQPVMSQVAGGVQNALGMGQQGSGGLSMDMFGGGNSTLAKGVSWLGEKFGSNAVSSFATGLGATSFSLVGASSAVPSLAGLTAGPGMAASLGAGTAGSVGAGVSTGAMAAGSSAMSYLPYVGALFAASQGQYLTAAGAAIGSLVPGIGTAIGAAVGALADMFVGDRFAGESRHGGSYNWTKDRGAVERGKWDSGNPGEEANKAIGSILDGAVATINSAFKGVGSDAGLSYFMGWAESSEKGRGGTASGGRLAIGGNDVAFGTTRKGQGHGDTSGDLGEMINNLAVDTYQTIIQAWQAGITEFPTMIQDMIRGIDADALTMDQAQAVVAQVSATIDSVNQMRAAFDLLPFENLKNLSFDATASLLAFGGGVEAFTTSLGNYYANFYSQEEQFAAKSADLATALSRIGIAMPALTGSADQAKAAFRAIVDSFDVTTEAGQRQYATMIGLSGTFAELTGVMEQLNGVASQTAAAIAQQRIGLENQLLQLQGNTIELRKRELATIDESNQWLQKAIWAREDEAAAAAKTAESLGSALAAVQQHGQAEIARLQQSSSVTDAAFASLQRASQEVTNNLQGIFNALASSIRTLRGDVDQGMGATAARGVIRTAISTGNVSDGQGLQAAIQAAQAGVQSGIYASKFEEDRAYLSLAAELETLQGITESELSEAQSALDMATKQYDSLRGIDSRVKSVEDAALLLQTAVAAEMQAMTEIAAIQSQIEWAQRQHDQLIGIKAGVTNLDSAIRAMASAIAAVAAAASKPASSGTTITARAMGGYTPAGMTLVGEQGPELVNFKSPGMVYTAAQSAGLMSRLRSPGDNSAVLAAAVDRLTAENRSMRAELQAIAKSTGQLAEQFDNVSAGGNALATEVMA